MFQWRAKLSALTGSKVEDKPQLLFSNLCMLSIRLAELLVAIFRLVFLGAS